MFGRRASSSIAAAAICWIVGKDNDRFSHVGGGMVVKDLMAHFGLAQGGVSQRADTLMKAAGFDPYVAALGPPTRLAGGARLATAPADDRAARRVPDRRGRFLMRYAASRSVAVKSSPTKSNGSLARRATAYVRQSPKFNAAWWRLRPKRQ